VFFPVCAPSGPPDEPVPAVVALPVRPGGQQTNKTRTECTYLEGNKLLQCTNCGARVRVEKSSRASRLYCPICGLSELHEAPTVPDDDEDAAGLNPGDEDEPGHEDVGDAGLEGDDDDGDFEDGDDEDDLDDEDDGDEEAEDLDADDEDADDEEEPEEDEV
jgi:hypothetical protein